MRNTLGGSLLDPQPDDARPAISLYTTLADLCRVVPEDVVLGLTWGGVRISGHGTHDVRVELQPHRGEGAPLLFTGLEARSLLRSLTSLSDWVGHLPGHLPASGLPLVPVQDEVLASELVLGLTPELLTCLRAGAVRPLTLPALAEGVRFMSWLVAWGLPTDEALDLLTKHLRGTLLRPDDRAYWTSFKSGRGVPEVSRGAWAYQPLRLVELWGRVPLPGIRGKLKGYPERLEVLTWNTAVGLHVDDVLRATDLRAESERNTDAAMLWIDLWSNWRVRVWRKTLIQLPPLLGAATMPIEDQTLDGTGEGPTPDPVLTITPDMARSLVLVFGLNRAHYRNLDKLTCGALHVLPSGAIEVPKLDEWDGQGWGNYRKLSARAASAMRTLLKRTHPENDTPPMDAPLVPRRPNGANPARPEEILKGIEEHVADMIGVYA